MENNVLAIIVVQIMEHDMVEYSIDIQKERDEALHIFYKMNESLRAYLSNKSKKEDNLLFMDGVDPMTGSSIYTQSGPSIYDEVDGGSRLLKWKTQQIQYCGILCHPKYGSHIYPSTIFTNYEIENVVEFFNEIDCKKLVGYGKKKVSEVKYEEHNFKCCN